MVIEEVINNGQGIIEDETAIGHQAERSCRVCHLPDLEGTLAESLGHLSGLIEDFRWDSVRILEQWEIENKVSYDENKSTDSSDHDGPNTNQTLGYVVVGTSGNGSDPQDGTNPSGGGDSGGPTGLGGGTDSNGSSGSSRDTGSGRDSAAGNGQGDDGPSNGAHTARRTPAQGGTSVKQNV
ncbi:hypothetical protein SCUP234_04074 [Seiridium cupressi]